MPREETSIGRIPVNMEELVQRPRYRAFGRNLILLPQSPSSQHCDRVLDRVAATSLERPPIPEELDQFDTLINVAPNKPASASPDEDLRVQSIYTSGAGHGLVGLATLFPEFQKGLEHFQTLTGLLFPSRVAWNNGVVEEDRRGNRLPEGNQDLIEAWLGATEPKRVWSLTHLLSPRKQAKSLESLIYPDDRTHRLGIIGLGDIGTFVASMIRQKDRTATHINDIFIGGSRHSEKVTAQLLELQHINIEGVQQPNVHAVMPGEEDTFFRECDIILILMASDIPTPGVGSNIDVRSSQFTQNVRIVCELLDRAKAREYDGQILMGSDPVEQLTMAMYLGMKVMGWDINTHQFAGFGGMINRSRAKAVADQMGFNTFQKTGRTYGPHGKMVVAIPTHNGRFFNHREAELLSLSTGHSNYRIRAQGVKPYIGPSVLIADGVIEMLAGETNPKATHSRGTIYASPFLPGDDQGQLGAFFGARAQYIPTPGVWTPRVDQPYLEQVMAVLRRAHQWTSITSHHPESLEHDPFTDGQNSHPAFHPFMMEEWMKLVMQKTE